MHVTIIAIFCAFASAGQSAAADVLDDAIVENDSRPQAPVVSRQVLIRKEQIRNVLLSADGSYLTYLVMHKKFRQLWLVDLDSGDHSRLVTSKHMNEVHWSADSRHLFIESRQGISVLALADPSSPSFVINLDKDREQYFLGVDKTHPHAILVSSREGANNVLYRVHADGAKQALYRDRLKVGHFLLDENGVLSFISRYYDTHTEILKIESGQEKPFLKCLGIVHDICRLEYYRRETNSLYMRARFGNDLTSLFKLDAQAAEKTLLHSDPTGRADLKSVVFDPITGAPVLAAYYNDFERVYGLEKQYQRSISELGGAVGSRNLEFSTAPNRWLVRDTDPRRAYSRYYLFDISSRTISQPLREVYGRLRSELPMIDDDSVAATVPVHYQVSDGMKQRGYITLPPGRDAATVPLVVIPHGGPFKRAYGRFDPLVQLLANRGYAVFQPNFRASEGFGYKYKISADSDFGEGRVHQDIVDGMNYVLSRGVGDRDKLGIVGHSFGGFSVLGALAFTPDQFKVGVAAAPAIDLADAVTDLQKNASKLGWAYFEVKELWQNMLDPDTLARLRAQSPNEHAAKVESPLYIWAGTKDQQTSILRIRDYALRQHESNKSVTLLMDADSGHFPEGDQNIEAYYFLFEKALSQHLGGQLEEAFSPALGDFLSRSAVIDTNEFISTVD